MIPAQELAARLVVGLAGPSPTAREWAWLRKWRPAGVILFARNVTTARGLAELCTSLRRLLPALEIMADHEGGPVAALTSAVGRPPAAWSQGQLDDTDLTWRVHRAVAERLSACGVDRVLGPVADVLTAPRNPVIGVRAFGADTELVARHVAAAAAGLVDGGCAACLKHWPGHGGTTTDSHLESSEIMPDQPVAAFASGLAAGADAIMLGHLHVGQGLPASLDPGQVRAARDLASPAPLRVFTDDVTMGALRAPLAAAGVTVAPGEGLLEPGDLPLAWLSALAATGADRLLVRGIPWWALPSDAEGAGIDDPDRRAGNEAAWEEDDPSWNEVQRRLAGTLPADFAAEDASVVWWDATGGDRWGPAAGDTSALVGPGTGWITGAPTDATACTRLVAASHRPLSALPESFNSIRKRLAESGMALGLGHPSLAGDLRRLLPSGWQVHHLPEYHPEAPLPTGK